MKRMISILLAVCCLVSMMPVYGTDAAHAEVAQQQSQQRADAERSIEANEDFFHGFAELAQSGEYSAADDGEWQYVVLPEENYAVITGHTDHGSEQVDIPAELGGADVVALLDDVFSGHEVLCSVTMTGNIYYAGADTLPRGVTVRGYHGSYAEKWAMDHRHAFENLSQMDFVDGVVDCSDISEYHFTRYDQTHVDMRALEARRLQKGSVFFLLDPYNPYAVSYYKVETIGEAQNGYVSVRCSTPELTEVLNSFDFENAPMVADWSTLETAEDVDVTLNGMSSRASGSASSDFGATFHLETKKLKDGSKISLDLDFSSTATISAQYANLKMETFKIVTEESKSFTVKKASETNWDRSSDTSGLTPDKQAAQMIKDCRAQKKSLKEWTPVEENCPLSSVYLVSWAGILSLRMDIGFKFETAGSFELTGEVVTKTTHSYTGGELKSTTKEKEHSASFEGMASGKAGPNLVLKLLVFDTECASVSLFAGVTLSAAMNMDFAVEEDLTAENIINAIESYNMSLSYLNMMDCVEIKLTLVVEVKIKIGGSFLSIAEFSATPVELPMTDLHFHIQGRKFIINDVGKVDTTSKTLNDWIHIAADCPLTDSVRLMVPSIDKAEPMGSVSLMGKNQLDAAPKLQLPDYGVRVSQWYEDFKLREPILKWPYQVNSGDCIYGETVKINEIDLIAYDFSALQDTDGNPVKFYLEHNETVTLNEDTGLADWDHIVGWVYIDPASIVKGITFIGDIIPGNELEIVGDGENHVLMAIRDNDLTIHFRDQDGKDCGEITTGHFIEVPEAQTPESPVLYDPTYAIAKYQWCDYDGTAYEFPYTFDENTGREITLVMTLTDIERIYTADDSATVMTGTAVESDGLTAYSDPAFFNYTVKNGEVTVTGFKSNQTYTDENGDVQNWTAVAEKLVIPSVIDGNPVTAIASKAFSGNTTLVSVEVPASVVRIGDSAFSGCTALVTLDLSACRGLEEFPAYSAQGCSLLSDVRLPGSLTNIGNYAFYECKSLKTVVTHASIGVQAFNRCTALESIELKDGVLEIGSRAFYSCSALKELYIPCSVKTIGDGFISGCTGLTGITFDGAPKAITANMMNIGANSSLTSVVMNLGVLDIGSSAFSNGSYGNSKLTDIVLPDALRSVGANALKGTAVQFLKGGNLGLQGSGLAYGCTTLKEVEILGGVVGKQSFQNCTNLEKVILGDNVVAVGENAFYGCTKLTTVDTGDGLESVGKNAFYNCKLLTSFDAGSSLASIGDHAFDGCGAMTAINMGSSLTHVGTYAFEDCVSLTELNFPPTVESFGEKVINGCRGLKKLTVGGEKTPHLKQEWIGSISNSQLETLVIGEGVTNIGTMFIQTFAALQEVSLPSTLETIGDYAFSGLKSLKSVNFPSGLTTIGAHAFENCTALNPVCPEDLNLITIEVSAFRNCSQMTEINLGDSLQIVGDQAFYNCSALTELHFPPTVISIGDSAMKGCTSLKHLSIGGPAMPATRDNWFDGISSAKLETVTIGEGVTEIGDGTFQNGLKGFPALHTVVLPSTLEVIGQSAFYNCAALGDVVLPAYLTRIGNTAFLNCSKLNLICPDNLHLVSIGSSAFRECDSLTNINLGSELKNVGASAFYGCDSLTELLFPPTVTEMGDNVYDHCPGLKTLAIGGPGLPVLSKETVDMEGVSNAALEKLIINEGVTSIGNSAFNNNLEGFRQLKTVVLPSTLETIGDWAFYNASALTALELPSGLREIGYCAFQNCTALTLVCPDNLRLEIIAENAFKGCAALTRIRLTDSLRLLGDDAFSDCTSLQALYIPDSAAFLDVYASGSANVGHGCSSLKVLSIGGPSVPEITRDLLSYKTLNQIPLETLIINEGVISIGEGAFNHHYSDLVNLSLPSTLNTIGSDAFAYCTALQHVNLPDCLISIAEDAFSDCDALQSVRSNAYNTVIAAFAEAAGLDYIWDGKPYTVTLMDGENRIATAQLAAGESLAGVLAENLPDDRGGMTFRTWHADAGFTAEWMQDRMPAFDLTLYAEMTPIHTVRFVAYCGENELWSEEYAVGAGLAMPWPNEPIVPDYIFDGWYTDAAMTRRFNSSMKMGNGDTIIYGKLRAGTFRAFYKQIMASYVLGQDGYILTDFRLNDDDETEIWLPSLYNGVPVVAIAADAFAQADSITRLHLPDHLTQIDPGALDDLVNLQAFSTGVGAEAYTAVSGVLYTKDMQSLVCFPQKKPAVNFRVPGSVKRIEDRAFRNAEWIANVVLPDSVTYLGDSAFAGCAKLVSFTAYGLTEIGENALPVFNADLQVFGPVQTGALRRWLMLSDTGSHPVFKTRYNVYEVALYVDGRLVNTIGIEAGSILPSDFIYGEMEDGSVIHDWFCDAEMQHAWNRTATTPAGDLALYTVRTPIYAYETAELNDAEGNAISGIVLTAYNGIGGALVLPRFINGTAVIGIGGNFLAGCRGVVSSVQIGNEVISIADTALNAPEEYPFGGIVKADVGSYAAEWAARMGYTVNDGSYALRFEANGGSWIAERSVVCGTYVKLPVPVKTGDEFLGWFVDAELTVAAELVDSCYIMPGKDTTLYASWAGTAAAWPFEFEVLDGEVNITAYTGEEEETAIPETVNGMPVTRIADYAFEDNQTLVSVVLPASVVSVGAYAFRGAALQTIDAGGTQTIGKGAFSGCKNLAGIAMNSVQMLGDGAFCGCTALAQIHIPENLASIGADVFKGCDALEAFTADANNVVYTVQDGILLCDGMTVYRYPPARDAREYTLPEGVYAIADGAFRGAEYLTDIRLPDTLGWIGGEAFADCIRLRSIAFTDEMPLTFVPDGVFSGCKALADVVLSGNICSIGSRAFFGCNTLQQIYIPESVEGIAAMAFSAAQAEKLTIAGVYGSEAWSYAMEYGFDFEDPALVPVEVLTIDTQPALWVGDRIVLTASVSPEDALLCGDVQWTSSDADVIYVYGSTACAISAGTATITATAPNGVSVSKVFEVRGDIEYSASAAKLTLGVGQSVSVCIRTEPELNLPAGYWTVSDSRVVSVQNGTITACGEGNAVVTAIFAGGNTLQISVLVEESLNSLQQPAVLTAIADEAYAGTANVQRVSAGNCLTSVGARAFADMESLVQAELPASVVSIADNAFSRSPDVVIICEKGSYAETFAVDNGLAYVYIVE